MLTLIINSAGGVRRNQLLLFFSTVFIICVIGYGYFSDHKRLTIGQKRNELAAIADLKSRQIDQWRKERLGEANTIHANAMLAFRISDYLGGSAPHTVTGELKIWMEMLCKESGYRGAALYRIDGTLLVSAADADKRIDLDHKRLVEEAVRKREVFFSDFHREALNGLINLNLVVPVGYNVGNVFQTAAVLVLDIDPHNYLYPMIQTWPMPSKTAETLLVERSGDDVLFLNEVRHKSDTALSMRVPLAKGDLPAVWAVLGQEGGGEGVDYRGVPVLAVTRTIPDSPWCLVAKVDLSEIYGPIRTRAYWVVLFGILLALAAGLGIYNWWLKKQRLYKQQQFEEINEQVLAINRELELRQREAEANQKKLQQLSSAVENSPASIVITDHWGRIEYVNPKFTEITGYPMEEVIGKNPRILNAGGQPKELYRELWSTIKAGLEWRGDLCNRKKNGDIYWEHASISPLRDEQGNITHYVAIKEDVTEQKRIAKELLTARDAAHAANRSKSEFLANMSHEIRTPLNAIIGFSALTMKSSLPPRQQDYVQKIHSAGKLLLKIINDILDFSKIEAGQLEMELIPFMLEPLLANLLDMVQQKASDKGLNLLVKPLPEAACCLVGDPHRLGQIIINLLNNAVKFTAHGEIVLEAAIVMQQRERVQLKFSVRDTGIGIPAELIDKLFQPFTQADGTTTRRFGGTGLGLSISKQLAEMMGGEIWCESIPGEGSIFCFTAWFGIGQASDMENFSQGVDTAGGDKKAYFDFSDYRILLVEDNDINRQLAIEILKETGAELHLAADGEIAVTMVTGGETSYDLVLMDIQMPVMDGYEATRLIRSDSRFATLPIIAMTAHAMLEEQQKILEAGMDAHITKPVDARTMLRAMAFFLRPEDEGTLLGERVENVGDYPAIPDIAGLDVSAALSGIDGDWKLYIWVLRSFVESQSNAAMAMEEALNTGDAKLAARRAHTVKSIAGTMGATELQALAEELENAIVQGEPPEKIRRTLDNFAAELGRLVADLTNRLPVDSEPDDDTLPDTFDIEVVTPILNRLHEYIKGRDGRAERYLDDYRRDLAGLPLHDISQIKNHLKNFDFAAAHEVLLALSARNGIMLASDDTGDYRP